MTTILAPYTSIADIDGSPLDAGFVYIGEQGKSPEASPVPVFWDAEFTIPAAQPIRTRNGYVVRNGSPAKIYLREPMHSISVKNRNNSLIFSDINGSGLVSTLLVRPSGKTVEQAFNDIDDSLEEKQQQIDRKASLEYVEEQLDLKANQDTTYSKIEVDSALDQKASKVDTYTKPEVDTALSAVAAGHKAYTTLALAQAAQGTLLANTIVEVTNDPAASNNGTYQWNGTTLTKSAYDPLTQAKADATTKANAAEANAKSYAEQIDKKIDYYQTENLVNPTQETAVGYYVNGVPNGNAGYISALDYYAVQPNQKIWIRGIVGGAVIAVYDSAKVYIGNINPSIAVNGVITIAATYGASKVPAFIRLSSLATTISGFGFGYGHTLPPQVLAYQEKYSVVNNKNFSEAISKDIIKQDNARLKLINEMQDFSIYNNHLVLFRNLVKPDQAVQQGRFNDTGVLAQPTLPNYYAGLDFIPVPINRKFWMKGVPSGFTIQLCDENKKPILAVSNSVIVNGIYTVPATAGASNTPVYYIRVCTSGGETGFADNTVGVGWAGEQGYVPTDIPSYNADVARLSQQLLNDTATRLGIDVNPLSGKRWVAMGDSITVGGSYSDSTGSYAKVLSDKYLATLELQAQNGARVHRENAGVTANSVLSERFNNITIPPDLITIAGGVNDPIKADTTSDGLNHLGTMADRVNTTFYGALHVLISGLRAKFPNARIGYIAPIPNSYGNYNSNDPDNIYWMKYKAIRDVCEYYSVPVWNGCTEFGAHPMNTAWKDAYMPDGLHPNNAGHVWYANRVEDFILSLAK